MVQHSSELESLTGDKKRLISQQQCMLIQKERLVGLL